MTYGCSGEDIRWGHVFCDVVCIGGQIGDLLDVLDDLGIRHRRLCLGQAGGRECQRGDGEESRKHL